MATYALRRFSCPETLKAIAAKRLLAFLKPHRSFLQTRGVTLPQSAKDGDLDYEELTKVFMTPDLKTPKGLIDSLYFVDEMATPEGMDALLAEAKKHNLTLAFQYRRHHCRFEHDHPHRPWCEYRYPRRHGRFTASDSSALGDLLTKPRWLKCWPRIAESATARSFLLCLKSTSLPGPMPTFNEPVLGQLVQEDP
jgi:hypothetical protein